MSHAQTIWNDLIAVADAARKVVNAADGIERAQHFPKLEKALSVLDHKTGVKKRTRGRPAGSKDSKPRAVRTSPAVKTARAKASMAAKKGKVASAKSAAKKQAAAIDAALAEIL